MINSKYFDVNHPNQTKIINYFKSQKENYVKKDLDPDRVESGFLIHEDKYKKT